MRSEGDLGILPPTRLDAFLFTLPALHALGALARPDRRLVAVAAEPLIPLLETIPEITEATDEPARLVNCQEAVLLSRAPDASGWVGLSTLRSLRRAAIPRCWAYRGRGIGGWVAGGLLTHPVRSASRATLRTRPAGEDFRELLAAMGLPPPASWLPRLEVSEERRQVARQRLERGGIPLEASPRVALIPRGRLVSERNERSAPESLWPWERFAELARELRKQIPGTRCLLVAGQEPLWPAVRIHEETARFVPLIGPDLDAAGIAALLALCDLAVAADSELLHLAAAVGTPTVTLFGPSDRRRRAPRGERDRAVESPAGDLRKLELPPVLAAVLETLRAG